MLRIAFALLALIVATPALAQDLVGEWTVDVEALINSPEITKLPEERRAQAIAMTRKMLANMRMVVMPGGKMTMSLNPKMVKQGSYKDLGGGKYELLMDGRPAPATLKGDVLTLKTPSASMTLKRLSKTVPAQALADAKAAAAAKAAPPIDFEGEWTLDLEATRKALKDPKKLERLDRDASRIKGMQLSFKGGKMSLKMGDKARTGTYTHSGTANGVTTLDTKEDGRNRGEVFTLKRDGAALHVTADNDTLVFTR